MRLLPFLVFAQVIVLSTSPRAAADSGRSALGNPIAISVTAKVLGYMPDTMHDQFDDGSFATYDGTKVRLTAPAELAGRTVTFHHARPQQLDSPWRAAGRTIHFEIDEQLLMDRKAVLFAGAAEKVRLLAPPCVRSKRKP